MNILGLTPAFRIFLVCNFLVIAATGQAGPRGRVLIVNSSADVVDSDPADGICADASGNCTLRAAITEANVAPSFDVICFALPAPATINLTLGDLRITRTAAVIGPGANRLTVQRSAAQGTPGFRVFTLDRNGPAYSVMIRGLTIKNGISGIYVDYDVIADISDVALTENRSVALAIMGRLNLTRALVNSNSSTGQGGGLITMNWDSTATVTNSTFTDNHAARGGAIYNNGRVLLVNSTIWRNHATEQGSSIDDSLDPASTVSVLNTMIGGDTSSVFALAGSYNSLGNNIVTDARGSTGFVNGVNGDQVSDANQIDLKLTPLTNNGGDIDTFAPQLDSPAIDRGNTCVRHGTCTLPNGHNNVNLASDQRAAYSRSIGSSVDVGAYETGASTFPGSGSSFTWQAGSGSQASGMLVSMISARTGERRTSITNPSGYSRFSYLPYGDVYIIERRSKRSGFYDPIVWHRYPTFP